MAIKKLTSKLKELKTGLSRKERGAVNRLSKAIQKGDSFQAIEKQLSSKIIKDVLNIESERKFGKNFTKISHYYKQGSKNGPVSLPRFRAIKIGKMVGWINRQGKVWLKMDSLDILNSLDALADKNHFQKFFGDTLVGKWHDMNQHQKAEISEWLSQQDWDDVFGDFMGYKAFNSDAISNKKTFLAELHDRMDKIMA